MSDDPEPTQYVVARVRDTLAHDERVGALDIQLRIVGTEAFFTGVVTTAERSEAVEAVVREQLPGLMIHNHLTVVSAEPPGDAEDLD